MNGDSMSDDVYLMLVDGKVVPVDLSEMVSRHRNEHIRLRADAIDQAADAMMCDALDQDAVWDAAAERMPPGAVDSAGGVALELWKVEHGYPDDE
jgi:hypothetical protein